MWRLWFLILFRIVLQFVKIEYLIIYREEGKLS